jgi:hypothetical protein
MRFRFLLLLPVLAALVFSAAAQAVIVPQRSIAGAKLGMTEVQVRARLGTPKSVRHGSNLFGPWRQLVFRRVTVFFQSGKKATNLTTKNRLERTSSGVGVGSTLTVLRDGLKGETCKKEFGVHHCWVGSWESGRVISDFRIVSGRVSVVTVGYVFD